MAQLDERGEEIVIQIEEAAADAREYAESALNYLLGENYREAEFKLNAARGRAQRARTLQEQLDNLT